MMKTYFLRHQFPKYISILVLLFFLVPVVYIEAAEPTNIQKTYDDPRCNAPVGERPTTCPPTSTTQTTTTTKDCNPNPGQANSCERPQQIFGTDGICTAPNITATNISGVVSCKKKLLMGPCELFELAVRSVERKNAAATPPASPPPAGSPASTSTANVGTTLLSSYACQEFVDPVPLDTIKNTPNALCIAISPDGGYTTGVALDGNTPKPFIDIKKVAEAGTTKYCNAIALKTTGSFDIIFSLVSYFFFIIQPLLIAMAVIMIMISGVMLIYKGSVEETRKKIMQQLQQVLMGLALLFLIKLFLTTVNGLFFVM